MCSCAWHPKTFTISPSSSLSLRKAVKLYSCKIVYSEIVEQNGQEGINMDNS